MGGRKGQSPPRDSAANDSQYAAETENSDLDDGAIGDSSQAVDIQQNSAETRDREPRAGFGRYSIIKD